MRGQILARGAFLARVGRQQQARLQEGEPGRHHQVVGRQFDPQRLGLVDEGQVLLGQLQDRDLAQVDLLGARQRQQQVERPLEAVDIDDQRLGGQPLGDRRSRLVLPLILSHRPVRSEAPQARPRRRRCQWGRAAGGGPARPRRGPRRRRSGGRRRRPPPPSRRACRCSAARCRSRRRSRPRHAAPRLPDSASIDRSSVISRPSNPISLADQPDHPRRTGGRAVGIDGGEDDMRRHRHRQVGERAEGGEIGRAQRLGGGGDARAGRDGCRRRRGRGRACA